MTTTPPEAPPHPAARRTPRDPRPPPQPRPAPRTTGSQQVRRRRRRRRRPAPRHRPRHRAGALRGAHLLRRHRPAALRRPVAAAARGRRRPGDHQPRQPQPGFVLLAVLGLRCGAARRRLVGRLRVPLAADHRRPRGGRRAADPGPAPSTTRSRRQPYGDVLRPGVRPGPGRRDEEARPETRHADRLPGPRPRPTRLPATRRRPAPGSAAGARPGPATRAAADPCCSGSRWRWSRWPSASSASSTCPASTCPARRTPRWPSAITGLMLVVGAFFGRAGGLILLGLLIAAATGRSRPSASATRTTPSSRPPLTAAAGAAHLRLRRRGADRSTSPRSADPETSTAQLSPSTAASAASRSSSRTTSTSRRAPRSTGRATCRSSATTRTARPQHQSGIQDVRDEVANLRIDAELGVGEIVITTAARSPPMSTYTDYPPPTSTDESGGHPVNVGHLVMGLAFLGLVAVWGAVQTDLVPDDDVRWLLPLPWVFAGAAGLIATAVAGPLRRSPPRPAAPVRRAAPPTTPATDEKLARYEPRGGPMTTSSRTGLRYSPPARRLVRRHDDRMLGGVCAGVAGLPRRRRDPGPDAHRCSAPAGLGSSRGLRRALGAPAPGVRHARPERPSCDVSRRAAAGGRTSAASRSPPTGARGPSSPAARPRP